MPLPPTPENIQKAKEFVHRKWQERAAEKGKPAPTDLSDSCKFSSLFAQRVFGGRIEGNREHQYVRLPNGRILDLNADAADVQRMRREGHARGAPHHPYRHDARFWGNPAHRKSLASCESRVDKWVDEFMTKI